MKNKSIKKEVTDFVVSKQLEEFSWLASWSRLSRIAMGDVDVFKRVIKSNKNPGIDISWFLRQDRMIKTNEFLKISLQNDWDLYKDNASIAFFSGPIHKTPPPSTTTPHHFYSNLFLNDLLKGEPTTISDAGHFFYAPYSTFKIVSKYMDPKKPVAINKKHGLEISAFEFSLLRERPSIAYLLMNSGFSSKINENLINPCIEMFFSASANFAIKGKKMPYPWQKISTHLKSNYPDIYDKEFKLFHQFCLDKVGGDFDLNAFMTHSKSKRVKKKPDKIIMDKNRSYSVADFVDCLYFQKIDQADQIFTIMKKMDIDINGVEIDKHPFFSVTQNRPLMLRLFHQNNIKAVDFLLKKGYDPLLGRRNLKTPMFFSCLLGIIHSATFEKNTDKIRAPLPKKTSPVLSKFLSKVDLNQKDERGRDVVEYISDAGSALTIDILDLLYRHGFDFSKTNPNLDPIRTSLMSWHDVYVDVLEKYKAASNKNILRKNISSKPKKSRKSKI